eukprot:TRINITY_DN2900_c0_g1_i2.p2 TRINITY_DN2900_c0_g1~~TRINITY_DN2900_c0_g1_i2.p2  ORF type:complete len:353 (-),score=116.37 TRINITY_DN2900_c0_g1_i2:108-1166(-)
MVLGGDVTAPDGGVLFDFHTYGEAEDTGAEPTQQQPLLLTNEQIEQPEQVEETAAPATVETIVPAEAGAAGEAQPVATAAAIAEQLLQPPSEAPKEAPQQLLVPAYAFTASPKEVPRLGAARQAQALQINWPPPAPHFTTYRERSGSVLRIQPGVVTARKDELIQASSTPFKPEPHVLPPEIYGVFNRASEELHRKAAQAFPKAKADDRANEKRPPFHTLRKFWESSPLTAVPSSAKAADAGVPPPTAPPPLVSSLKSALEMKATTQPPAVSSSAVPKEKAASLPATKAPAPPAEKAKAPARQPPTTKAPAPPAAKPAVVVVVAPPTESTTATATATSDAASDSNTTCTKTL